MYSQNNNNKRNCYNNRTPSQLSSSSRADRVTSWRGGLTSNSSLNYDSYSSRTRIIHSEPSFTPFVDNTSQALTRAPPGITPLCDIPLAPWENDPCHDATLYPFKQVSLPPYVPLSNLENHRAQAKRIWAPLQSLDNMQRAPLRHPEDKNPTKKEENSIKSGKQQQQRKDVSAQSWSKVVSRGISKRPSGSASLMNRDNMSSRGFPLLAPKSTTPTTKSPISVSPSEERAMVIHNPNETRYLSESLTFSGSSLVHFSGAPQPRSYVVFKVENIPWSISSTDIRTVVNRHPYMSVPSVKKLTQSVHIMMDPKTGKTGGVAFIETQIAPACRYSVDQLAGQLSTYLLQGRHLRFLASDYDQLCCGLFNNWKGTFSQGVAVPETNKNQEDGRSVLFIGQKELQSVLNICRNYKVFYNRRCPERSFEYLMSITTNIPWLQKRTVSTIQRDILYECYKLVIEALRIHLSRPLFAIESSLMSRMVRAAILCDGFTVKQKQVILKNAQATCPTDLAHYLVDHSLEQEQPYQERLLQQGQEAQSSSSSQQVQEKENQPQTTSDQDNTLSDYTHIEVDDDMLLQMDNFLIAFVNMD